MRVMKFGGTSVGTSAAIEETVQILASAQSSGPVVGVVSAMGGITNLLLGAAEGAASGTEENVEDLREQLLDRHRAVVGELISDRARREKAEAALGELIERSTRLIESIQVLGDLSPRVRDMVVSFGERMSSVLVSAILEDRGVPSSPVASDKVIVTDDTFGSAAPFLDQTRERAQQVIVPLIQSGVVPIVTGFFGANASGAITTLGRGGSDYSAAILGHALQASDIIIWTDVNGVMTADPRLVPDARTLPSISFSEATELAYFGAKVIHPRTMQPAADLGIPIWIKNTFNPDHPGTRIGSEPSSNGSVKAITAIPNVSIITVEGSGFLGVASVTGRVFSAVGNMGINVFMISQASSQHSLSFIVPGIDGPAAIRVLEQEFEFDLHRQRLLRIWEDPDVAAVAVVGAGMRGTPGVAGRVFQTLGAERINILTIAQGSSELNISCAVPQRDIERAVPALHRAFELDKLPAS